MSGPWVAFLSDYGLADEFVGVCHGVIARRCPRARVIDLTHQVPRHDVRAGALALAAALPYLPAGVALAVVDPGVGAPRRALALATARDGRVLVGPDNGLLLPAAERFGGVARAFDIGESRERLEPLSRTFHGRDLFAPVAAAVAAGVQLEALGVAIDPRSLAVLRRPSARVREGRLEAHVERVDGFGNLALDAGAEHLSQLALAPGEELAVTSATARISARLCATFADVAAGEALLYEDSTGALAVALNRGSAAQALGGVLAGTEISLERSP